MNDKPYRAHRGTVVLAAAAVMILAAAAYLPSVDDSFLQDDFTATRQFFAANGEFQLPRHPDLGGFPTGFLPFWTHLADSYFWGPDAVGHHVTSVLLHVLATVLVFVLVRRLTGGRVLVAFFTAVFFGLCPLHYNAVGWISGRSLPLAILFLLVATLAATGRRPAPVLAAVSYVAAMLCHPAALTAPVLALALDLLAGRGAWRKRLLAVHLPLLALMVVYVVLVRAGGQRIWRTDLTLAALRPAVFLETLARLVVPLNEAITNPAKAPLLKWAVLAGLLPLQVVLLAARRAAPPRVFWVGLVWFVVMLLPILSSATLGRDLADSRHFYGVAAPLYLMLAALFFADTAVFRRSAGVGADRRTLARATAFALAFAVVLTLCLYKNGQAYAGAGRLVRHVQQAAIEAARREPSESWIYVMDPPAAYAGAPVLGSGLKAALAPPFRHDREARRIGVVRSDDTTPLIAHLGATHPALVVVWMDASGPAPRRPFTRISPLFPETGKPAEPFIPPRFAGRELATWRPLQGLTGEVDENGFRGRGAGDDPWLLSPPMVIPMRWLASVTVRMSVRAESEAPVAVDLFWALLSGPEAFRAERCSRRVVPATGKMETVTFALAPPEGAERPETFLARLRLDPPGRAEVRIESVTLVPGPECPGREQVAAAWEGAGLRDWVAPPGTTATLEGEDLVLKTNGEDPYAVSPVLDLSGPSVRAIEVTMRVDSASTQAAIYWATDTPEGFREEQSRRFAVTVGDGEFHRYTIPFQDRYRLAPGTRIRALRVDPMAGAGTAWIRCVKVFQAAP